MNGAVWSVAQQAVRLALFAVFFIVVSNQIQPAEFGLFGIASMATVFMTLFLDPGFAQALVQRREVEPRHWSSVLAFNLFTGLVLCVLGVLIARPVSEAFGEPAAAPLIMALSAGFVPTALVSMQAAMAQRELRFKSLALRDLVASLASVACGLGAVALGLGVWSIVVQSLVFNFVAAAVLWNVSPVRVSLSAVSLSALRELWPFGSQMFIYSLFKYATRNLDTWIVASLFGPQKLGIYIFAKRATFDPMRVLEGGLGSFIFARASQLQADPNRLKQLYLLSYKVLNYGLLAFGICAVVFGRVLIPRVFGSQWTEAAEIVAFLSIALLVHPACLPMGEVLKATHRPSWLLWWAVFVSVLTNAAVLLASPFGFQASMLWYALSWLLTAPVVGWILYRILPLSFGEFSSRLWISYLLLAALGVALYAVYWFSSAVPAIDLGLGLVVCSAFAFLVYALDSDMKSFADSALKTFAWRTRESKA